ncbi:sugar ABC transporter permease [Clostridium psychrophilum]|nr:sugar ABC transporter permease [Clostridium psychrophilum]
MDFLPGKMKRKKRSSSMLGLKRREKIDGWLFVSPFVVSVLVFIIGPLLVAFMLSFKQYSFLDNNTMFQAKWIGLDNYKHAFVDPTLIKAFSNTFLFSIVVVPCQLIIALMLALIVDSKIKFKTFFRAAYYIPTLTSTVAVSVMFLFLFKSDGVLNIFMKFIHAQPHNWFGDPKYALPTIMIMAIWSSVGMYMVIFLAGLQEISVSLYEAAEIDGANRIQEFFYVTLPLIKPVFFFNLVVSFAGTFQMYDQAAVISGGNGGPDGSTMTVVLYMVRTGFKNLNMGYACAIAFLLFIVIFTITIIQKKLFGEENVE